MDCPSELAESADSTANGEYSDEYISEDDEDSEGEDNYDSVGLSAEVLDQLKHNDPDLAVDYLKSSVATSVNNPRQKGYSYLKLGELNYDYYKNYELAQAYYDSTVSVLPQDEERFAEVKERSEILTDFVNQLKTIQLQDSLLALSEMNSAELQMLLAEVIAEQERLAVPRTPAGVAGKLARRHWEDVSVRVCLPRGTAVSAESLQTDELPQLGDTLL